MASLKLWIFILTNIGSPWAEAHGILNDTTDDLDVTEKYTIAYAHIMKEIPYIKGILKGIGSSVGMQPCNGWVGIKSRRY